MSAVLDSITGGGLLPHVRCHNIIIGDNKVTLNLELWQEQDVLYNSSWLNDLNVGNQNLLDSIFIQVVTFREYQNILRLEPDYDATNNPGNIYTAKHHLGDNYLPRAALGEDIVATAPSTLFPAQEENIRPPIQVSNSSVLGQIDGGDALPGYYNEDHGQVQQQFDSSTGKRYFVVPFSFEQSVNTQAIIEANLSLGFAFYTFLDVPYWLKNLDIGVDVASNSDFFEQFIIEGPPNAEIVYRYGAPSPQRYTFLKENGQVWNGAVHLHTEDNPGPDNYFGDGSINSQEFTGWMAGESHNPQEEQEKLYLTLSPNNKIIDQASGTEVADGVFVL